MKKLFYVYDVFLKSLIATTSGSFVILILVQVFCRYVLSSSLAWSEEVCKLLFYATIMFGTAVCVTEKRHIVIDILPLALSRAGKRWLFLGIYLLMLLFGFYIMFFGYSFAMANMRQATPALQISFGRVYMVTPIAAIFFIINTIRVAIYDWTITYAPENGRSKAEAV